MAGEKILKLRLSLKGRPVRTYAFKKEVITVGRNPESDVFLDNPGISRDHLRIFLTPYGSYAVEDLSSANGTLINDVMVKRQNLLENDVIQVGKYSLWATYELDRRHDSGSGKQVTASVDEGTTVLSSSELHEMVLNARRAEEKAQEEAGTVIGDRMRVIVLSRAATGLVFLTAFASMVIGIILGAAATHFWVR